MYETYDKLSIADEMLDGAIRAFLDSQQFFVALNLAGVAEELYGKAIRFNGGMNSQSSLVELSKTIARLDKNFELNDSDLLKVSVMYKNAIKHLDAGEQLYIEIDVKDEARSAIGYALTNRAQLDRQFTPNVQRFYEFGRISSQAAVESI